MLDKVKETEAIENAMKDRAKNGIDHLEIHLTDFGFFTNDLYLNFKFNYYDYIKIYADRKTIKSTIRELGPRSISAIGKKMSRYFYAVKVGYSIDEVIQRAEIDEVYVTDLLLRFVRFLRKIFKKKPLNDPIYESK